MNLDATFLHVETVTKNLTQSQKYILCKKIQNFASKEMFLAIFPTHQLVIFTKFDGSYGFFQMIIFLSLDQINGRGFKSKTITFGSKSPNKKPIKNEF